MWNVVFNQQNFIFSVLVAEGSKASNEVTLWVAGVSRPLVDGDDDSLVVEFLSLARLNSNSWYLSLSWNEDVPGRSLQDVGLNDSAVLSPLPLDDSNDFSCRLRFFLVDVQHFLCLVFGLDRVIGRIFSFVFQNDFTWRCPLSFWQQFHSNNIAIDGSVQ